jgi:multicomponent Na+:H+ antiporter subunit F
VDQVLWGLAAFLVVTAVLSGVRVVVGPTPGDRLTAAMMVTTTGVAAFLVLADVMERPAIRDVALLFVLLSPLASILYGQEDPGPSPPPGAWE